MAHLPTTGDWRDLARQIQNEKDPFKMIELVGELIVRLEAEQSQDAVRLPVESK